MNEPLPERIEATIRVAEKRLTAELRELTGRDDLVVTFDRSQILPSQPLPEDYWETAE